MNYIELIKGFWQCNNERPIGCNATALYFYLLKICNSLGWKESFKHSDRYIALQLGISVNTVRNSKNKLKQIGLIDFKSPEKASKGLDGATSYKILSVSKYDTVANTVPDTVANTVPDTDADMVPDTRNKLNKTKLNYIISPDGDCETNDFVPPPSTRLNYQKILDLYHNTCVSFPKIENLSDSRKKKLKSRIDQFKQVYPQADYPAVFYRIFFKAENSSFAKGDNSKGWKMSFDWMIENDKNWMKLIEGNYDNKNKPSTNPNDRPKQYGML